MSRKIHPRYFIATRAYLEIDTAVSAAIEKHQLTYGELMHCLARVMQAWAGWQIKDERNEDNAGEGAADPILGADGACDPGRPEEQDKAAGEA